MLQTIFAKRCSVVPYYAVVSLEHWDWHPVSLHGIIFC
jgi:hypothetical protein